MTKRVYLMTAALMLFTVTVLSQSQSQPSSQTTRPQSQPQTQTQSDKTRDTKSQADKTRDTMKSLSSSDRKFVNDAHEGGMHEVAVAQLALSRATNADVKTFAQRLIDDHSKANDELMQIASGKGITLTSPPPPSAPTSSVQTSPTSQTSQTSQQGQMTGKQREMMDRMNKLSGADFDRDFIKNSVKDHEKDVAMFEKQANGNGDPEIKAFAAKTLPTLREHLQQARDLAGKVSGTESKSTPRTSNSSPERSKP